MVAFNPAKDIGDLSGKVFFITGGTAGLGAGSVEYLAAHNPAHIYFTGRNEAKAKELIESTQKKHPNVAVTYLEMDCMRLSSVQACAKQFLAQSDRLDVLMCNAGIMAVDPGLSKDGYEVQFQVNHLAHALLIKLLLPVLGRTADEPGSDVRIINMSSIAYRQAPKRGIEFESMKTTQATVGSYIPSISKWARYGEAKLANLLYPIELAKRYPKILSVAVHPGVIMTGLFDGVDFLTKLPVLMMSIGSRTPVEEGPYHQLWAATADRSKIDNGGYYEPIGVLAKKSTRASRDEKLAETLWVWSQEQLEGFD